MDIRVTATDKVFYQVDPTLAALLMEAFPESFKQHHFNKQATLPKVDPTIPVYGIRKNPFSDRLEVVFQLCGNEETFSGHPDLLSQGVFGGKAKRVPPQEIIDRYRLVYESANASNAAALLAADKRGPLR